MRRAKRQVTDIDLIKKFVDEVEVVRIAINGDKYPYVVPVNFGYSWNDEALSLYIHGASEGKKSFDDWRKSLSCCRNGSTR